MKKRNVNASEIIIMVQSIFLMLVAVAGLSATDAVNSMYNSLTNASSAAYIITDGAVVTESGTISTDECLGIIRNFELVSVCMLLIGLTIFVSSLIRLARKATKR